MVGKEGHIALTELMAGEVVVIRSFVSVLILRYSKDRLIDRSRPRAKHY